MKKTLSLLLLTGFFAYAQPNIGTPQNLTECDLNNDGVATFNLRLNDPYVLSGLDAGNYTVNYYETEEDAQYNVNAIPQAEAYTSIYVFTANGTQAVYVRVTSATDATFSVASFLMIINPVPTATEGLYSAVYDDESNDGIATFNLSTLEAQLLAGLNPQMYSVLFYTSEASAQAGSPVISSPSTYASPSVIVYARLQNEDTSCFDIVAIELVVLATDYVTTMPQGDTAQTFTEGQTLANLVVNGQNIEWYATATGGTPLSPDTPLEEGVTYYAAQTVYGIESTERLPVTAQRQLSTQDNLFKGLSYYPNPVQNVLTISAATPPDAIEVYSLLGQVALRQIPTGTTTALPMQSLQSGLYMVKIYAGNGVKTIKVIKE